ncbi:MAG: group 1 glycosyl transferase [Comamonas sp. SCN 65-56]|jgi:glycosyltransferase involved in cell wall biosynthesis|uniref:glycosyltransferase n=1 Tax=Comamonas sp. SCN 65-56 TaxID=1660095 RepID=UPI00086ED503|nr:glycosyltransferase [Comamonas sp. SCN 65-56]ODS91790.1 MAG: group 1 glycosyl transferase [Comamonas sp. SCN 65-56]GIK82818.1 MAG: glycosyl transferase family 1 [Alphaproteobacteria bacterium]
MTAGSRDERPLVAHVIDELPPDGAERLIVDVLRRRSARFRYVVVCLVRGGLLERELQEIGVPVVVLGSRGGFDFALLFRLVHWLRREHVAVVHTHLFAADAYGRVAARLAGVRAVFSTVHSVNAWKSSLHRSIDSLLARISTQVIACTDEVGQVLRHRDHLPAARVTVVPNGIDLRRFEHASGSGVRDELGIPTDVLICGVIGRLHPAKGHADLFEAIARLRAADRTRFVCLLVGDGELRAGLEAAAHELGIGEQLRWLGLRADVPRLLAALEFVVMPSRWEGLPMALLEAMACEKAVIATRVGGIPDVVRDQVDGLLVDSGNIDALARGMVRLMDDPTLRRSLGQHARQSVLARYDVSRTTQAYESMYAQALGVGNGDTAPATDAQG